MLRHWVPPVPTQQTADDARNTCFKCEPTSMSFSNQCAGQPNTVFATSEHTQKTSYSCKTWQRNEEQHGGHTKGSSQEHDCLHPMQMHASRHATTTATTNARLVYTHISTLPATTQHPSSCVRAYVVACLYLQAAEPSALRLCS